MKLVHRWLVLGLFVSPAAWAQDLMLNEATVSEIASLEGVSEQEAARIVEFREQRGELWSVEELRALGLEPSTLRALQQGSHIVVDVPQLATPEPEPRFGDPEAVLAEFAAEPTVQQVHSWANHHAQTSPRQVRRWLRQSVQFATLPQVQVELQVRSDWDQGFDYLNADGAELLPAEEPIPVRADADQGQAQTYRIRLVWDLDKLVMSSERIRIIHETQDVVKLRDQVLAEATRVYFERRRLQVERLLAPRGELSARVREELRLRELTAQLDALTGGAFSAALTPTR